MLSSLDQRGENLLSERSRLKSWLNRASSAKANEGGLHAELVPLYIIKSMEFLQTVVYLWY